jgi:hypothetical protein
MTRQSDDDRQVIANAEDLDFLVLDELNSREGGIGIEKVGLPKRP